MDIATAVAHHQSGDLQTAEKMYREILQRTPDHPDALHLLGLIHHQVGQQKDAIALIEKAISHSPKNARFYSNLGVASRAEGLTQQAIDAFQQAVKLDPNHPQSLNNLAVSLSDVGDNTSAEQHLRRALKLKPDYPDARNNLGITLKSLGRQREAIQCYEKAIQLDPNFAEAYNNLGIIYKEEKKLAEAAENFNQALKLRPQFPDALNNLGNLLVAQGNHEQAIEQLEQSLSLAPDSPGTLINYGHALRALLRFSDAITTYNKALEVEKANSDDEHTIEQFHAEAYNGLGSVYKELGWLDDAAEQFNNALKLQTASVEVYINLGTVLIRFRRFDDALEQFHRALEIAPDNTTARSNIVYVMNLHPGLTPQEVFQQHLQQGQEIEQGIEPHTDFSNEMTIDRPLRIGYLSPDFCEHVVARFIQPILANHDSTVVETFCYANVEVADTVTEDIKHQTAHWRDVRILNDDDLVEQIRNDRIDILVDLAGHTSGNRLKAMAQRAAPVQVTYLGYPNTTGMQTMDYRITDEIADPSENDEYYSEELIRLESGFLCYQPLQPSPEVGSLPADENGYITFGSLNRFEKLNDAVLKNWVALLKAVPESRLLFKAISLQNPSTNEFLFDYFKQQQIDLERILIAPYEKTSRGHLGVFNRIDIALDAFPYSGTTSTCDALWMGVPVITLAGEMHVSRVSASLLTRVGLQECIASDWQQYLEIAQKLASESARLREIRGTLRSTMAKSDLSNGPKISRALEQAYQQMWQRKCQQA